MQPITPVENVVKFNPLQDVIEAMLVQRPQWLIAALAVLLISISLLSFLAIRRKKISNLVVFTALVAVTYALITALIPALYIFQSGFGAIQFVVVRTELLSKLIKPIIVLITFSPFAFITYKYINTKAKPSRTDFITLLIILIVELGLIAIIHFNPSPIYL